MSKIEEELTKEQLDNKRTRMLMHMRMHMDTISVFDRLINAAGYVDEEDINTENVKMETNEIKFTKNDKESPKFQGIAVSVKQLINPGLLGYSNCEPARSTVYLWNKDGSIISTSVLPGNLRLYSPIIKHYSSAKVFEATVEKTDKDKTLFDIVDGLEPDFVKELPSRSIGYKTAFNCNKLLRLAKHNKEKKYYFNSSAVDNILRSIKALGYEEIEWDNSNSEFNELLDKDYGSNSKDLYAMYRKENCIGVSSMEPTGMSFTVWDEQRKLNVLRIFTADGEPTKGYFTLIQVVSPENEIYRIYFYPNSPSLKIGIHKYNRENSGRIMNRNNSKRPFSLKTDFSGITSCAYTAIPFDGNMGLSDFVDPDFLNSILYPKNKGEEEKQKSRKSFMKRIKRALRTS